MFRQALKVLSLGFRSNPNLVRPDTSWPKRQGVCSRTYTLHTTHLLHRLSPAVNTVCVAHGRTPFFLSQDSAVSRRVWPWTGFRGSWVSFRTPAWGKCLQRGPHITRPLQGTTCPIFRAIQQYSSIHSCLVSSHVRLCARSSLCL